MSLREKIAAEIRLHGKSEGLWTAEELASERDKKATYSELATADRIIDLLQDESIRGISGIAPPK